MNADQKPTPFTTEGTKEHGGKIKAHYTRFDIFLAVIFAFALMVALAYFAEPWNPQNRYRYVAVAVIMVAILALARNRRLILGCALGIVTFRAGIGLFGGTHVLAFLGLTAVCGTLSWLLLRDYR